MEKVKKETAKRVLNDLLGTISVKEPKVEDGYARRFRESIKSIFGEQSDFYKSAKEINFYFAHSSMKEQDYLGQDDPSSSCGIARDLLGSCLNHLDYFETYTPPKPNYLGDVTNRKLTVILATIFLAGMAIADLFHGSDSVITNIFSILIP